MKRWCMDNGGWLGMMAKMKKIIHRQTPPLLEEAQAVALLALGEEVAAKAAIAVPWHKIQMLVCVRAGEQGRGGCCNFWKQFYSTAGLLMFCEFR